MVTRNEQNLVNGTAVDMSGKKNGSSQNATSRIDAAGGQARQLLLEKLLRGELRKGEALAPIPRRAADALVPLSFAQQRVWLHAQLAPQVPIYNEPMTITRTGALDMAVLERCMLEIVRRHEIWRTTFDTVDGQPVQVVHPVPASFSLPVIDLRSLPEGDRQSEALRLVSEEGARCFDLNRGPLVRALVLRLGEEHYDLFFNIHQIVLDGVTAYHGLFRELVALYGAFSKGRRSPLLEPTIQYGDYAVWHRDWVSNGKEVAHQMAYWEENLAGKLPVLQWPNDHPRPAAQTFSGKVSSLMLPKNLVRELSEFSQREGVTLYMSLLAGFVALMHRYTGQEDVIVGTLSANRKRPEIETMLGYFLNPLPLRTDVSGNPEFRELLRRVRQAVSGALSNDDVPFGQLVKQFHKKRDLSRNPLFQVVVALEPAMPSLGPGWDMVLGATPTGASKLDLYINFDERRDGLMAAITYNPDLFEEETIERMVEHWQTLLEEAIANPSRRISALPMLAEAERRRLVLHWNATERPYPRLSIPELFEAQAQKTPDAPAFLCGTKRLSFQELNQSANRLAHYLEKAGVGPGVQVGICVERSLDMVVGLLGIVKAGGAFVPLDPNYPADRLNYMMEDANAPVLVTHKQFADLFQTYRGRVVNLDRNSEDISRESDENPKIGWSRGQLSYVIYTSGSTGKPKGVAVEQEQVLNRLWWMWREYPFEQDEVGCQRTPLNFVDSIWEIFGPLLQGTVTVIVPDEVVKDPAALVRVLGEQNVSRLWLVPSLLRVLLDSFPDLHRRLPRLKFWVSSGEPLTADLLKRFQKGMRHAVLYNLYGTSEVWDATWYVPPAEGIQGDHVSIGRPIDNVQAYILDEHMQPVPEGVTGELYIGGAGLARGYVNRPELTAEKFVADTVSGSAGARLYKTGDLARYLADGNIDHLGRCDRQVKIRGFRIELGEIESALQEHHGVKQAVALARDGEDPGAKQLVAYVIPAHGRVPKVKDLRTYMKRRLPAHMMPGAFMFLESFPLLPNGKIDRRALPAPERTESNAETEFAAPRNDTERRLAAIWEEALGARKIGIRDDFFELGGHSLLIPSLLARIEKAFGKKMSPASIFQAPTIERLADFVSRQSAQLVQVMPIQPAGTKPAFFCVCLAEGPLLRDLALLLGDDQPFLGLGLDPTALDQLAIPYRLEEIASHLVRAIREHQPEGPYYIGGFCLNGLIAFETARQLEAQGQEVGLLALFEALNPAHNDRFSQRTQVKTLAERLDPGLLRRHLSTISRLNRKEARAYVENRLADIKKETRGLFWTSYVELRQRLLGARLPRLQQILYVAARAYRPVPYEGRTAFFRCTQRRATAVSELEKGWFGVLAGEFELHVLEGDHLGILVEPSLHLLAEKLEASLAGPARASDAQGKARDLEWGNEPEVCNNPCGLSA